jgi:hypothetical protein
VETQVITGRPAAGNRPQARKPCAKPILTGAPPEESLRQNFDCFRVFPLLPDINNGIIKMGPREPTVHSNVYRKADYNKHAGEHLILMHNTGQHGKERRQNLLLQHLRIFAVLILLFSFLPETAALAQSYKAAEPKLDSVPAPPASPEKEKTRSTLKGGIQKVDKRQNKPGKFMFGARQAQQDALRGRAANENSLQAQAQSSLGIIGVKFVATFGKPPVINEIFPNTPAEKVGLRVYDMIVAVDGVPTSGLTKDEVFDLIVGTPGTQVSLSILRNSEYSAVTCTRMDINELIDPRIRRDYMMHM